MPTEPIRVLFQVADVLERLAIPYAVGGSLASSHHGEPRSTNDIDIVIALRVDQAAALAAALSPGFHVDEVSVREAIARRRSFNVVDRTFYVKVDLFVAGDGVLDREQLERRLSKPMTPDSPRLVSVTSPENIVLRKLDWYRQTDETSDRQWRDVIGVLKARRGRIDLDYLTRTAAALGLGPLLERAVREAASSG